MLLHNQKPLIKKQLAGKTAGQEYPLEK